MMLLCGARLMVAVVPLGRWKDTLGLTDGAEPPASDVRRLAAMVEQAARRLPFETKCLPRAITLSWILRRRKIAHSVVFAVRPEGQRDLPDALHAWIEVGGSKVLGDLPGPWIETLRLGS